jgi:hypothetical protein
MGLRKRLGLGAFVAAGLLVPAVALALPVTLVQTLDPGFYNNHIGTVLNLSNTGVDNCNEPFPVNDDCHGVYPTAPNLSAANAILGNWLTNPGSLNANWSGPISIPNSWTPGTEVAVIYQFNTLGATGVQAQFGVDNGIFVWLDGVYQLGRRDAGGVSLGEYSLPPFDLAAGTHYLQLLLEDHGSADGYAVLITAATFTPGPAPGAGVAPEPASLVLLGTGLLAVRRRFMKRG